jgi:hypothetical protein
LAQPHIFTLATVFLSQSYIVKNGFSKAKLAMAICMAWLAIIITKVQGQPNIFNLWDCSRKENRELTQFAGFM